MTPHHQSRELGLFVIPIKFNAQLSTYGHYLDFLVTAESAGYTHAYIGEHLTDKREDIQSSIVFASALLAKTKSIKVCLSVLPLPHYDIPLLIKQLEDLSRLANGRLLIGFSQGALASDFHYLNLDVTNRSGLFYEKLNEFIALVQSSPYLCNLYPHSFFSTLLSPFPTKSSSLFRAGYGALSSNFCHPSNLSNHISCLTADLPAAYTSTSTPVWNIALNLLPFNSISARSQVLVRNTLIYIFDKLKACGLESVMTGKTHIAEESDSLGMAPILQTELIYSSIPRIIQNLTHQNPQYFGHYVINLFDCFDDPCYSDFLLSLPNGGINYQTNA